MECFRQLFGRTPFAIIGMIHVDALPGTPGYKGSVQRLIDNACSDALVYDKSCVHGVLVENMHDIPYVRQAELSPETVAVMTRVCMEVRRVLPKHIPCGVQILAGGNREALATALASNFQFMRCEGFVFSHIADEGFIDACAGQLLRYRKYIDADDIKIFTDIKKKHSAHTLTADITIEETALAAEFFSSDGLIVTGNSTGNPADISDIQVVRKNSSLPILVGSGVDRDNLNNYIRHAHGAIIGSHFKKDCRWQNRVSEGQVLAFMEKLQESQFNEEDHVS